MRKSAIENQVRSGIDAARRHPWAERVARWGFVAKGLVYVTIGVLAAIAAVGSGGETTDTKGAIRRIAEYPFGQALLTFLVVGLLGYAAWRFIQAFANSERESSDFRGWAKRVGYGVAGVIHVGLAWFALQILIGGSAENGNETAGRAAWLMRQPFGEWLVALVGCGGIAAGVYQIYFGLKKRFLERLRTGGMSRTERQWSEFAGKWGHAARGIVFGVIGMLLLVAAKQHDPSEAQGLEGALDALANQPYGPVLLGCVAVGLAAYGVYMFVEARYRSIRL